MTQNYTKVIYNILYKHFEFDFLEGKDDLSDEALDEFGFKDFATRELYKDYIKNSLSTNQDFADELTVVNGKGGEQNEQIGMIEFINQFSNLNLKIEDFRIERKEDDMSIEINYIWNITFVYKKKKYEYLGYFFNDFIFENYEKIWNEVVKKSA